MTSASHTLNPALSTVGGDVPDYFALLKPRVMVLVIFTALVGMSVSHGQDRTSQRQHAGQSREIRCPVGIPLAGHLRDRQARVEAQARGEIVQGLAPWPIGLAAGLPVHRAVPSAGFDAPALPS